MQVRAITKFVRISPYKLRAPVEILKGKQVDEALNLLKFMPLKAAKIIYKTLSSAVANAEHNHELDVDELVVRNIIVDQGPTLKRFRARARGRGARILKRSSHITVIVEDTV
ncbi:MAG: 50S ribosomal protein L22 [Thermodesulfobacteriota bacterium]|nr:50S ribosomal protein L22 [Thermodesulfobacteriota bacterium]